MCIVTTFEYKHGEWRILTFFRYNLSVGKAFGFWNKALEQSSTHIMCIQNGNFGYIVSIFTALSLQCVAKYQLKSVKLGK